MLGHDARRVNCCIVARLLPYLDREKMGHSGTTNIDNQRPDRNLVYAAVRDAMMRTTADWVAEEERLGII